MTTRREFLRVGSLTGLGLSMPQLHQAVIGNPSPIGAKRAKACILVWLDGGPSHIDTLDPKPDAPSEVRGPFSAIGTSLVGVRVSELLPKLAARLDRCALIRSMTSPLGEHNLAAHYLMTGYQPSPVIAHPPFFTTVAALQTPKSTLDLPASVAIPDFKVGGGGISGNGFLPPRHGPFSITSDPSRADFAVRNLSLPSELTLGRLDRRQAYRRWLDGSANPDPLVEQAFEVLRSPRTRQAFDLTSEPEEVRDRYGRKSIGQSCLLARRLVEAGVPLVSVIDHGWDTHADVVTRLRDGFTGAAVPVGLGPSLDAAVSSLIDDLQARGLFDETLVVVMGEFGRTPKWNSGGGRDHWPRVFSVLLAGGPIQRGVVFGSSDRHGESPHESPVTPADLTHTIYYAMGVDPAAMLHTSDGRPIRIADETSQLITGVLA